MAPWLTFVIGIIVGLVIGWLIDMLYRRAPRPEAVEAVDRTPDWAQPLPSAAPAPELPGVAASSSVAVAAVSDEGLDVPPHSETAEVAEEVNWRDISARVDEVGAEIDAPRVASERPDETGLTPSAAETLAPSEDEDAGRS
jgi:hypothetical protein